MAFMQSAAHPTALLGCLECLACLLPIPPPSTQLWHAVWPTIRTRLFSSFATRAELITAVLASCHLPTLSDGRLTVPFAGGAPHIDGGLLSVITPPPGATHSALVCSMPSAQIERLPPFISRPAQPDIAISPDSFQAWPHSRSRTTELALEPPGPEFVAHMVGARR